MPSAPRAPLLVDEVHLQRPEVEGADPRRLRRSPAWQTPRPAGRPGECGACPRRDGRTRRRWGNGAGPLRAARRPSSRGLPPPDPPPAGAARRSPLPRRPAVCRGDRPSECYDSGRDLRRVTGATMGETRKFTILHSNDMHGDFLAEQAAGGGELIGGLPLLSGYINKVRAEEENVLYVISGDMVQGSIIDSDFKGISTMQIMNYLAPDVVAPGQPRGGLRPASSAVPREDRQLPHRQRQPLHQAVREADDATLPHHQQGRLRHPVHRHPHREGDGLHQAWTSSSARFVTLEEAGAEVGKHLQRLQERRHRPHHPAHPHRLRIRQGTRRHARPGVGRGPDHRRAHPHDPLASRPR